MDETDPPELHMEVMLIPMTFSLTFVNDIL